LSQLTLDGPIPPGIIIEEFDREKYRWYYIYEIKKGISLWKEQMLPIFAH